MLCLITLYSLNDFNSIINLTDKIVNGSRALNDLTQYEYLLFHPHIIREVIHLNRTSSIMASSTAE